jgi:cell filamentation protein
MADESRHHHDRYDVSGNVESQYVDKAQTVLANKRGITDLHTLQVEEEESLVRAYTVLFAEIRATTPMTCGLLKHIHRSIFGDLYDWAGQWRTVNISKPGITWPPPFFIPENMELLERQVFANIPPSR